MKTYKFAVSLCDGWCSGYLEFDADSEDEACDMAMACIAEKLNEAFPALSIDYDVECENPDGEYEGRVITCPNCGEEITIEFDTARCGNCDWFVADAELDGWMNEVAQY